MLPLIKLPKRVAYVDDKGQFLDTLRLSMNRNAARQFFDSPDAALEQLRYEIRNWRSVQELLTDRVVGADTAGLASEYITGYFNDWRRFHMTTVLVVDYGMPRMNGLEMLRRLGPWPGRKVLLTGEADAAVAIDGFNAGLIQQFLPKGTPRLFQTMNELNNKMHAEVCFQLGQLLYTTIDADRLHLLSEDAVKDGILDKVEELEWVEYIVLGHPFGLLGATADGKLQFLQLETATSLPDVADLADQNGVSVIDVKHIRAGAVLPNIELAIDCGYFDSKHVEINEAFDVCANPWVIGAVATVPLPILHNKNYVVDDIMTTHDQIEAVIDHVGQTFSHIKTLEKAAGSSKSHVLTSMVISATKSHDASIDQYIHLLNVHADNPNRCLSTLLRKKFPVELQNKLESLAHNPPASSPSPNFTL